MKHLCLRLIIALLTFSIGYSAFIGAEIYNLKVEMREYERQVESDRIYEREKHKVKYGYYDGSCFNVCARLLEAKKKNANMSNMTLCIDECEKAL